MACPTVGCVCCLMRLKWVFLSASCSIYNVREETCDVTRTVSCCRKPGGYFALEISETQDMMALVLYLVPTFNSKETLLSCLCILVVGTEELWDECHWISCEKTWLLVICLTTCGESVDWKLKSTPMAAICSSHLRLTSLLSSSYSPLLLKRRFSALTSCSANAHSAPTRDWQNMTSRRNWSSVSVIEEYRRIHDICINIVCTHVLIVLGRYDDDDSPLEFMDQSLCIRGHY